MMRMVVSGGRKKRRKMLQWRERTTLLLFMSPEEKKWLSLSLDDIKEMSLVPKSCYWSAVGWKRNFYRGRRRGCWL